MLDTATVGAVAGGAWSVVDRAAPLVRRTAPTSGAGTARVQLLESADGRLVQSVGSYAGTGARRRAAVQAVEAATERLQTCGFTRTGTRGSARPPSCLARTAADGTDQVVLVLAAEGVGVVLMASGTPAERDAWESLADLALGSSCAAAADGSTGTLPGIRSSIGQPAGSAGSVETWTGVSRSGPKEVGRRTSSG